MSGHEVMLPVEYEIKNMLIVIGWLALTIFALRSVIKTSHDRSGSKFWWSALVIVLPVIGALIWFVLGAPPLRRRARRQTESAPEDGE